MAHKALLLSLIYLLPSHEQKNCPGRATVSLIREQNIVVKKGLLEDNNHNILSIHLYLFDFLCRRSLKYHKSADIQL